MVRIRSTFVYVLSIFGDLPSSANTKFAKHRRPRHKRPFYGRNPLVCLSIAHTFRSARRTRRSRFAPLFIQFFPIYIGNPEEDFYQFGPFDIWPVVNFRFDRDRLFRFMGVGLRFVYIILRCDQNMILMRIRLFFLWDSSFFLRFLWHLWWRFVFCIRFFHCRITSYTNVSFVLIFSLYFHSYIDYRNFNLLYHHLSSSTKIFSIVFQDTMNSFALLNVQVEWHWRGQ